MKKKLALLLALVMAFSVFTLAACGSDKKDASNDDKTFVVGFDAEFPPYGYKNDKGEYVGFDLDLARELCKRKGWTFKAQPIDWDSKDMELNSGTIDCIWNGFTMNGREDSYTFSTPYIDNSQVIVVKSDSGIYSLADLAGKVVAVQTDSSAEAVLKEDQKDLAATFGNLDVEKDYNSCFMNLESGAVDAIAMDVGVADYQISQRGDAFRKLDETLSSEQYAIGFKKGNTALRDEVQAVMNEMFADGTVQKLAEQYGIDSSMLLNTAEME